jgi:hypothetical protein
MFWLGLTALLFNAFERREGRDLPAAAGRRLWQRDELIVAHVPMFHRAARADFSLTLANVPALTRLFRNNFDRRNHHRVFFRYAGKVAAVANYVDRSR